MKKKFISTEPVIPASAIPNADTFIIDIPPEEGVPGQVIERNEAMYTTYVASLAEQSPFFLAVVNDKKIIGARCPKCGMVICPPFMTRCNRCQNVDMSMVDLEVGIEMPQRGTMLNTPPITVFANARMAKYAPFGRGRVMVGDSFCALPIQVFTTTGFLKPGIFQMGTEVKIVFRTVRTGYSTDYFAVPMSEVPEPLRDKDGLEENELEWKTVEVADPEVTEVARAKMPEIGFTLKQFVANVLASPRACGDLGNWNRRILVKTSGGQFGLLISTEGPALQLFQDCLDVVATPDLVLVMDDPSLLVGWASGASLVNMIRDGRVGISNLREMETIFKLDRLHRSMRRDKKPA